MKILILRIVFFVAFYGGLLYLYRSGSYSTFYFLLFWALLNHLAALYNIKSDKILLQTCKNYSDLCDILTKENNRLSDLNIRLSEANIALRGGK